MVGAQQVGSRDGRCFGGSEFPHQLILRTQHPSIHRRSQYWELAALLVIPGFFWRLKSLPFCFFFSGTMATQPPGIRARFFFRLSPLLIASSGNDWESTLITIHSQTLPSSQSVSVILRATSCVRGAHVTLPSWGGRSSIQPVVAQVNAPRISLVSLLTDLSGDNRYSLLHSTHD